MSSLTELAEKVGVSPATVSIVLNNRPLAKRVSAKTREKILVLAQEMNYRPNHMALAMQRQTTQTIAFICGRLNSPFYAELADDLAIAAEKHGYRLMVQMTCWDTGKELEALEMIASRIVDGIVLFSGAFPEQADKIRGLYSSKWPLVVLEQRDEQDISSVNFDIESGMRDLFGYLLSRGFKSVAMADDRRFLPKQNAYRKACEKWSITPEFFDFQYWNSESIEQCARQIALERPEALVIASDYAAAHIISVLGKCGVRIPHDISIASIDGTRWSELYNPPLSAVCQNTQKMAEAAIDEIIRRKANPETLPRNIVIPTELRILNSIASKQNNIQ